MNESDWLIVGGGISGLSALHFLKKRFKDTSVVLLEKEKKAGGLIQSEEKNGFLFEHGPRSFLAKEPATAELIRDLDLEKELVSASQKSAHRYIYFDKKVELIPNGLMGVFKSPLTDWPLLHSVLTEWRVKSSSPNGESVADFVKRRWGPEMLARFVDPMVSGVFSGHAEKLEMSAVFPGMVDSEKSYGSLMRAFFKKKKTPALFEDHPKKSLLSFKKGMAQLTGGIASRHSAEVKSSSEIVEVKKDGSCWRLQTSEGESFKTKNLLLASPINQLQKFFSDFPAPPDEVLAHPSLLVTHLAWSSQVNPSPGFGCLIPSCEGTPLLGVLFNDCIFPHLPKRGTSLTCILGGMHHHGKYSEQDKTKLEQVAKDFARESLGISENPEFTLSRFYDRGIPQYNLGYEDYKKKLLHWTEKKELHLLGNYLGGVALNDCIRSARDWANSLAL